MKKAAVPSILVAVVLLALGVIAQAQQPKKVPRIGILSPLSSSADDLLDAFRQGLRELGYVEGRNIVIEYRSAEGRNDRLPELAAELVRLKVDVLVTTGPAAVGAGKQATSTIPIVMGAVGDAVDFGFVASLARPGGNITGMSWLGPELNAKRLELLKEVFPKVVRVAVLWDPATPKTYVRATEVAARSLGINLRVLEVAKSNEFDHAFATLTGDGAGALEVMPSTMFASQMRQLVDLAAKSRLPAIFPDERYAQAGGLLSYGPSFPEMYRRAATYVDKILKGAKPGDLPVEQPMRFEFIINLKAAKQIGLTIPPNVLARADRVIK
jgi:putative tryptophan/tyrosine transport system substrate-binding protein